MIIDLLRSVWRRDPSPEDSTESELDSDQDDADDLSNNSPGQGGDPRSALIPVTPIVASLYRNEALTELLDLDDCIDRILQLPLCKMGDFNILLKVCDRTFVLFFYGKNIVDGARGLDTWRVRLETGATVDESYYIIGRGQNAYQAFDKCVQNAVLDAKGEDWEP